MKILKQAWRAASRGPAKSVRGLPVSNNGLGKTGRNRMLSFRIAGIAWFAIVAMRLFDLQVIQAHNLKRKAVRQQEATVDIPARRGGILDRHGRDLALSTPAQSIGVFADRVKDPRALAASLSKAVAVSERALLERLQRGGFQWVKRLVTLAEAERARGLNLEILHFETESKRYYPHSAVAAHVIGTVGLDHLGQAGLEQRFEDRLSGEPGVGVLQSDARQQRYGRKVIQAAIPGDDLVLDLDLELQKLVHMELDRAVRETKSRAGTFVLLEPNTGEVLAMSSWPRFNPNSLSRTPADLENLRNFAVSHLVEPGSTFKVLTASAALEEGKVTTEDSFDCEMGGIWVGRRRIRDHQPYGMLTMPQVLVKSSNVGIIKIGQRLGDDRMHRYIRRFGFGSATGILLPGEVPGLVRPVARWSGSSLASLSMGQEVGVTALQMARLFASIANGGTLVRPRVVRGLLARNGTEIEFERQPGVRVVSAETAATMQAILEQVVESGTGRLAKIPGYRVAGKTGTAQMINPNTRTYANGPYLASFCGFAPVNDPELVGVAMLYDPRGEFYYGGRIAAPLFAVVLRKALRLLDVPPSRSLTLAQRKRPRLAEGSLADFVLNRPEDSTFGAVAERPLPVPPSVESQANAATNPAASPAWPAPQRVAAEPRFVPQLRGLTMREALAIASKLGITVKPHGSGVVHKQSPEPNKPLAEGQILNLYFGLSPVAQADSARSLRAGGG